MFVGAIVLFMLLVLNARYYETEFRDIEIPIRRSNPLQSVYDFLWVEVG